MLSGSHIYTMDPKGRVMLPRAFREALGRPFIVTRAPGPYLLVFSRPTWERIIHRLQTGDGTDGEASVLLRIYLGCACECVTDASTGRFLVPPPLREHAGLRPGREAVVSGLNSMVEVWSKAQWDEATRIVPESVEEIGQLHQDLDLPEPQVLPRFGAQTRSLLGVRVLEARGHFNLQGAFHFRTRLEETAAQVPSAPLIVDLRRTTGMNAVMLQLLLAFHKRYQEEGRPFSMVVRTDDELLVKERLAEVKHFTSLESALWWLESESQARPPVRRLRRA